ncbi:hypothetical protein D3C78_1947350 [compost metagenome]
MDAHFARQQLVQRAGLGNLLQALPLAVIERAFERDHALQVVAAGRLAFGIEP